MFAIFGCSAHSTNELRRIKWLKIDRQFANRNCYFFARLVSINSNFLFYSDRVFLTFSIIQGIVAIRL